MKFLIAISFLLVGGLVVMQVNKRQNTPSKYIDLSKPENVEQLKRSKKLLGKVVTQFSNDGEDKTIMPIERELKDYYRNVKGLYDAYSTAKELADDLNLKSFATLEEITIGIIKKIDDYIHKIGSDIAEKFFLDELIDYYSHSVNGGFFISGTGASERLEELLRIRQDRKVQKVRERKQKASSGKLTPVSSVGMTFEKLVARYRTNKKCDDMFWREDKGVYNGEKILVNKINRDIGTFSDSWNEEKIWTVHDYLTKTKWIRILNIRDQNTGERVHGGWIINDEVIKRLDQLHKMYVKCEFGTGEDYREFFRWTNTRFKKLNDDNNWKSGKKDYFYKKFTLSESDRLLVPKSKRKPKSHLEW